MGVARAQSNITSTSTELERMKYSNTRKEWFYYFLNEVPLPHTDILDISYDNDYRFFAV